MTTKVLRQCLQNCLRFDRIDLMQKGLLSLKDGSFYEGFMPPGCDHQTTGEVVFTTGMVGYVETLTDPSYAGQIILFTYPLIGNYGVPDPTKFESKRIYAKGIIVSELAPTFSHYEAKESLLSWCKREGVAILEGVDTRAITKRLRAKGTVLGGLAKEPLTDFSMENDLISKVTISTPTLHGSGKKRIIAVDCGMKENIMRHLTTFPWEVKRVPAHYDYSEEPYDGLFLSNGPGDPLDCKETIAILQKALKREKPIFGICLGTQLLTLATGGSTYKLPFGHRSQNQPCLDLETNRCILTSQNHGYAVDEKSLPSDWSVSFRNLNDGTVEGIRHNKRPIFAVQFHPEAAPGPEDSAYLFQKFYEMVVQ